MATEIGFVKAILGEVTATSADGSTRTLQAGDRIFANELITTGPGGAIEIEFADGSVMDLGRNSQALLDNTMFDPTAPVLAETADETVPDDIAAIQQALLEGEDPTQVGEATAAGAGNQTGNEGHSAEFVDYLNPEVTPSAGFDTVGVTNTYDLPEEDIIILNEQPSVAVSVGVGVDIVGDPLPGDNHEILIPEGTVVPLGVSAVDIPEGTSDGGSHPVSFLITLSEPSTQPVSLHYKVDSGTAENPTDYFDGSLEGDVTIPPGYIGFVVTVYINEDRLDEGNEYFSIVLSDVVGATLTNDTATVTIIDDDTTPVANDDSNTLVDNQEVYSVNGNVLTNDTDADGDDEPGNGLLEVLNTPINLDNVYGTLSIQQDGSYTFTLNEAGKAYLTGLDSDETFDITFTNAYQISDGVNAGNFADVTITIEGINDAPTAIADTNWAQEDVINATGNVLQTIDHSTGAPDAGTYGDVADTDADVEPLSVSGFSGGDVYGSLSLGANGDYTYTLNNADPAVQALDDGETLTEIYTYTVSDGDDTDTATLTITVFGSNDAPTLQAKADPGDVYEAGLAGIGSDAAANSETTTGSFSFADTDGLDDIETITIGGTTYTRGVDFTDFGDLVGQTVDVGYGTVALTAYSNGEFDYIYTLDATVDNDSQAGATDTVYTESFDVSVSDGDASDSITVDVGIVDDVPNAENDTDSITEDATPNTTSGNVLTNDVHANGNTGADGVSFQSFVSLASNYGTLTDDGNGDYTYTLDNTNPAVQALDDGETLTETYTYTVVDSDGDTSTATLTITINGSDDTASVVTAQAEGPDATVYEAGLNPDGSDAASDSETVTGTFTVSATDGILSVVIGGTTFSLAEMQAFDGGDTVNTGEGTLTLTDYTGDGFSGTISYSYTLDATIDNDSKVPSGDDAVTLEYFDDSVEISVNGVGGTTASDDLVLRAIDDVPAFTLVNDANDDGVVSISAGNANATYSDIQFADWTYGADGFGSYSLVDNSTGGTATINGSSDADTVIIDLKDADGVLVGQMTLNSDGTDSLETFYREYESQEIPLLTSSVTASGPALEKYIDASPDLFVTITGSDGDNIPGEADDQVNPSTPGWAVDDNQIDAGESLTFSFDRSVTNFSFVANGFTGNPSNNNVMLAITVLFDDGMSETYYVNASSGENVSVQDQFGFGTDTTSSFTAITIESVTIADDPVNGQDGNDGFRLNNVNVTTTSSTPPDDLDFDFTLANVTDGDGDTTQQDFSVTLEGDAASPDIIVEAIAGTSLDDVLTGTDGDDLFIGGAGADTFVFSLAGNDGNDTIKDFDSSEDILQFIDVIDSEPDGDIDLDDLTAHITDVTDNGEGASVVVTFDTGATLTFEGAGTLGNTITSIDQLVGDLSQIHVS